MKINMSPEKNAHFERNCHLSHHGFLLVGPGVYIVGRESSTFFMVHCMAPPWVHFMVQFGKDATRWAPVTNQPVRVPWVPTNSTFFKKGGVKFHLQFYIPGSPKKHPPCLFKRVGTSVEDFYIFFLSKNGNGKHHSQPVFQEWWAFFF